MQKPVLISSIKPSSSKKLHLDRMRNDKIFYCPTNDYVKTFLNSKILQEHISMGKHVHNLKGIDQVKQIRIHHITNSDFNKLMIMIQLYLTNQIIASQWAGLYPQKRFTRFSFHQPKYIYNLFIQGETTGRKATPKRFSMI